MAISRSLVATRFPFARSVYPPSSRQLGEHMPSNLSLRSRWAGVAPITRTSMRKSQVSALCDDQQNEKCRNNDRGNEPAHNVTFICPAESIVNWLRHHVHMGTIISTGKLGPLPKPRSRTG